MFLFTQTKALIHLSFLSVSGSRTNAISEDMEQPHKDVNGDVSQPNSEEKSISRARSQND